LYLLALHFSDESFFNALARARERGAERMADAVVELTDADLKAHEDIGRARLRMQSRQWHSGKFNAQFTDKAGQTNIALGVQISVAEPERLKLIQARRALALGQGDNIRQLRLI